MSKKILFSLLIMAFALKCEATDFANSRRRFLLGSLATLALTAKPSLCSALLSSPTGGPAFVDIDASEILFQQVNSTYMIPGVRRAHILRIYLHGIYRPKMPGAIGFQNGSLSIELQSIVKNWADAIVKTQMILAQRTSLPLNRVEIEAPDILEPDTNRPYWIRTEEEPVDPRPESLGLDFHRAFISELAHHAPDLSELLNMKLNAAMTNQFLNRFTTQSALGAYVQRTGRRLTVTKEEFDEIYWNIEYPTLKELNDRVLREGHGPMLHQSELSFDRILTQSTAVVRQLLIYLLQMRSRVVAGTTSSARVTNSPLGLEDKRLQQELNSLPQDENHEILSEHSASARH